MIKIKHKEDCTGCCACYNICPQKCITMKYDSGFWYPDVDKNLCIDCGLCERVCPIINFETLKACKPDTYAAYIKNEEIRKNSSSGGLFTALAAYVINNGGVVFGAAFDDEFNVVHKEINSLEDMADLRGSKYVQSKIGYAYKGAKEYLDKGILVYFSGTACQIDGLKHYLGKDYNNLICQDLICHGVPSPLVWQKYLCKFKTENNINNINFRDKTEGWIGYSLKITDEKGNLKYINKASSDLYLVGFLRNIYLRPSCYSCKYKTAERAADITLADFWGIENELPEMFDDKGTSLVLIHSEKGRSLFDKIKADIVCEKTDLEIGAKYQSTLYKSAFKNLDYNKFFKNLDKMSFEQLHKKYFGDKFILKAKRKIARSLDK